MSSQEKRSPPPTRRGHELAEVVSALQKCIRRGDPEGSAFWALEMDASGFTAYVFRRLATIASENCFADPMAAVLVAALRASWEAERQHRKSARGGLYVAHAAAYLARAKKARIADSLLIVAGEDAEPREIPDVALDGHTRRGRQLGRGWSFFFETSGLLADPETGELTEDGALPDPFRERARAVLERPKGRPANQMTIEGEQ